LAIFDTAPGKFEACFDDLVDKEAGLTQVLPDMETPSLDTYLVYPEELKSVARVQAFREFLVAKAQRWAY
jgi:DNA-binding transcriptional LysR family regulator